ncbi:MAG: serine acetyltransferase [Spirochaetales bacterium]|nr:serine acetyltransferase [Spirochaetales bacterium]
MPSVEELTLAVELLRSVIFPGYFLNAEIRTDTMKYYTGSALDRSFRIFSEQIKRGFCFSCCQSDKDGNHCITEAEDISRELLSRVPYIREMAASDAAAAFNGDPAAKSVGEAIFCYPSVRALTSHRIAHELYKLQVPLIPRIISESAHSETGLDIHPGATIGKNCFIDHATGTVIGETSIIGENVRIYQGVTLGSKSFPMDEDGNPIKGVPRHPIVEDNVVIYAGATILGRVTIGEGAEIGGNVWLTRSVAPGTKILQRRPMEKGFENGTGI